LPARLVEIQEIYATHLRGDKIDIPAIEARLGRPLANEQQDYTVDRGVAVLQISGVLANKANMFQKISGGASAQQLEQQVQSMRADPRVNSVVLDIDSPGGSVLGIPALGEAIRALAAEKPTVSVCTGSMCSAAYWVGSAANAVYISGITDYIGSIGVVATHQYDPKAANVQTTEITAGAYKRIASENQPLSKEGKAYIQQQVDHLYSAFVDTVASNRKVSADQVLAHMADGRLFIGQQAIDAGLVDGVSTVDAMVAKMADNPDQFGTRRKARIAADSDALVAGAAAEATQEGEPVTPVESQPEIKEITNMTAQELADKFAAESPEAAALLRAEGSKGERDRIQAVRAQAMPGHEALIDTLAFDGKSTAGEAALAIVAAEKAKSTAAAAARAADAVAPVAQAPAAEDAVEKPNAKKPTYKAPAGFAVSDDRAELHAKALQYQKDHPSVDYLDAVKAVSA
jgi:signal peptide peptidase SppA